MSYTAKRKRKPTESVKKNGEPIKETTKKYLNDAESFDAKKFNLLLKTKDWNTLVEKRQHKFIRSYLQAGFEKMCKVHEYSDKDMARILKKIQTILEKEAA